MITRFILSAVLVLGSGLSAAALAGPGEAREMVVIRHRTVAPAPDAVRTRENVMLRPCANPPRRDAIVRPVTAMPQMDRRPVCGGARVLMSNPFPPSGARRIILRPAFVETQTLFIDRPGAWPE